LAPPEQRCRLLCLPLLGGALGRRRGALVEAQRVQCGGRVVGADFGEGGGEGVADALAPVGAAADWDLWGLRVEGWVWYRGCCFSGM